MLYLFPLGGRRVAVAIVLSALGSLLIGLPSSAASTIRVSTTVDELTINGRCSLREAVIAANEDRSVDTCVAGTGADVIVLKRGTYQLSIEGILEDAALTGDLDVTGNLSITGVGRNKTIIRGDATDRVIQVLAGSTVAISALSVVGVTDMVSPPGPEQPGYFTHGNGGGIFNAGTLSLSKASVSGTSYGYISCRYCWTGDGGGIYNDHGTLNIRNSIITGKGAFGGAITSSYGTVRIQGSQVAGEALEYGSAMTLYATDAEMTGSTVRGSRTEWCCSIITGAPGGTLTIRDSKFLDNEGGINNVGPGVLKVYDTEIAGNYGVISGALGLYAPPAISNGGTAELVRVSITDNEHSEGAIVGNSGSMSIRDSLIARNFDYDSGAVESGGQLLIKNTTVSGNAGTGLFLHHGTIRSSTIHGNETGVVIDDEVQMANTVLAGNGSSSDVDSADCRAMADESLGQILSLGYVFLQDGADCHISGDTSSNLLGVDPLLGPLSDNGGSTLSHMPLAGSPLIDAASILSPGDADAACPLFDQIGVRRPKDGNGDGVRRCDIGAIERPR